MRPSDTSAIDAAALLGGIARELLVVAVIAGIAAVFRLRLLRR